MIIGTHNSMTYLRPKQWWGYLFIPFWRCQKRTIQEQWDAGVRCFDLRVTFEEYGKPVFAHGIVRLKGDVYQAIAEIAGLARQKDKRVCIRLVCECLSADDDVAALFNTLCFRIEKLTNLVPFEGRRKSDWKLLYDFKYKPRLTQHVGSMAPDARWYEKFMPKLYAKRMNEHNKPHEDISLYDFI